MTTTKHVRRFDIIDMLGRFAPLIFLISLMIAFTIAEPRFLSPFNLFNVMRQISITGLLAIGMTFVILTAGIDLSVGALLAFAGLVGAAVAKGGLEDRFAVGASVAAANPFWLALLAAILIGIAANQSFKTGLPVEINDLCPQLGDAAHLNELV